MTGHPEWDFLKSRDVDIDIFTPYEWSNQPVMLVIRIPVDQPGMRAVCHLELDGPGSDDAASLAAHFRYLANLLDPPSRCHCDPRYAFVASTCPEHAP